GHCLVLSRRNEPHMDLIKPHVGRFFFGAGSPNLDASGRRVQRRGISGCDLGRWGHSCSSDGRTPNSEGLGQRDCPCLSQPDTTLIPYWGPTDASGASRRISKWRRDSCRYNAAALRLYVIVKHFVGRGMNRNENEILFSVGERVTDELGLTTKDTKKD